MIWATLAIIWILAAVALVVFNLHCIKCSYREDYERTRI